jgi:hypothetical protein
MKKDELYAKILGCSVATYYNYAREGRPIIKLLNQFLREELEEFVKNGEILALKHYNHWRKNSSNNISLIHKLAAVIDASDLDNYEYLNFLALIFISFRQSRLMGLLPSGLQEFVYDPNEVDFSTLYNFFLLSTKKDDLFESLHNHTVPPVEMLKKLNSLNTISLDESEHLSYLIETYLDELVEIAAKREDVSIDEMKSLVMLSLIINAADWHQDLNVIDILKISLPKDTKDILFKTKSKSKLLNLYHMQRSQIDNVFLDEYGGIIEPGVEYEIPMDIAEANGAHKK